MANTARSGWAQLIPVAAGALIPLGIAVAGILDMSGLGSVTFPESVLGALVGGGVMLAIAEGGRLAFGREAMGTGDVKLMAAVGACVLYAMACRPRRGVGGGLAITPPRAAGLAGFGL